MCCTESNYWWKVWFWLLVRIPFVKMTQFYSVQLLTETRPQFSKIDNTIYDVDYDSWKWKSLWKKWYTKWVIEGDQVTTGDYIYKKGDQKTVQYTEASVQQTHYPEFMRNPA